MKYRILVIADIHWSLSPKEIQIIRNANTTCDFCICLGDILLDQLHVIKRNIEIPIVGVLGNHDEPEFLKKAGIENIHGKITEIQGIKIAGLSGSPKYAENPHRIQYTQEDARNILEGVSNVPADILISHSGLYNKNADKTHVGFQAISGYMKKVRPAYVIHGHNHVPSQKAMHYLRKRNGKRSVMEICLLNQITVDQLQELQKKQMDDFLDAWKNRDMQKLHQLLDQNRKMRNTFTNILKDCPYQSEMAAIRIAQTEEVFKKLYLQDMDAASENDKK